MGFERRGVGGVIGVCFGHVSTCQRSVFSFLWADERAEKRGERGGGKEGGKERTLGNRLVQREFLPTVRVPVDQNHATGVHLQQVVDERNDEDRSCCWGEQGQAS